MSKSRITSTPRSDIPLEQARDLRARAWDYVFACNEAKKKAGEENAGGGTKGHKHDHPARRILPR